MGGKSKVEELKKKSTVFPPVLCGSRVLFLSTCTLVGRLPLFCLARFFVYVFLMLGKQFHIMWDLPCRFR